MIPEHMLPWTLSKGGCERNLDLFEEKRVDPSSDALEGPPFCVVMTVSSTFPFILDQTSPSLLTFVLSACCHGVYLCICEGTSV